MEALAQQMEEAAMQKEPELVPANEAPAPAAEPSAEQPPAPSPAKKSQQQGDLLDEVADKSIPKTINMSFEEDRANQVVSPGESTFDGTSTIGSSTSEPTTETNNSRTSRNRSSRKTPSSNRNSATNGGTGSRAGSRGGNSRGSNRKAASSNNQPSPATNSGRRTYHRNTYSGSSRMQSSTVPRPFKRPGPLSYSKTVRLGGSSAPFSAREVDDKTRAVLADMNEYDSAQLETE